MLAFGNIDQTFRPLHGHNFLLGSIETRNLEVMRLFLNRCFFGLCS
jgi:hypothetical protein